jgi:hypothetical protein
MTKLLKFAGLLLIGTINGCCNENVSPCQIMDVETPVTIDCQLTRDLDTVKMFIDGTWTWLQEERRQRGQPIKFLTPKTEGYSRTLVLDNEKATFYKCNEVEAVRTVTISKWTEITGTNYPEDEYTVLSFYDSTTGKRTNTVPIKICDNYLILQYQYVSSIIGEETWQKQ